MKCHDCNGTGESFGSFACSRCMGSGELKEMTLTNDDLIRLRKNGVGGFTTIAEQNALLDMAAELLRRREADRWIPVSERNPLKKGFYPVWYTLKGKYDYQTDQWFDNGWQELDSEYYGNGHVLACWHEPFPEPPEAS